MTITITLEDIPEMLHDAWLKRVGWNEDERILRLEWEPLRRGSDELLEPLRNYFEGHVSGSLERVARAESIDADISRRLAQLQDWNPSEGSWEYARSVEKWWQNGDRAAVTVRGIEHWEPIDDEPPEDREIDAMFALQKADGRWIIRSWSKEDV